MKINNKLILKGTFKDYEIKRFSSTGTSQGGEEIKNSSTHTMSLSIFYNGRKSIKKLERNSLIVHKITIYTEEDIQLDDRVPYKGRDYIVASITGKTINKCEAITDGN